MDWTAFLVVGLGSAAIAAFISGGFQLWAESKRRKYEERKGVRDPHAVARDRLMPELLAVTAYVDHLQDWSNQLGELAHANAR